MMLTNISCILKKATIFIETFFLLAGTTTGLLNYFDIGSINEYLTFISLLIGIVAGIKIIVQGKGVIYVRDRMRKGEKYKGKNTEKEKEDTG